MGQARQQQRIGAIGSQLDRMCARGLSRLDGAEPWQLRAAEIRVGDPLDGEGDVLCRQRHTVMETHVIAQLQFEFRFREVLPRRRDRRLDGAIIRAHQKLVENVHIDIEALIDPLGLRIERYRFGRGVDDEKILGRGESSRSKHQHHCDGGKIAQLRSHLA